LNYEVKPPNFGDDVWSPSVLGAGAMRRGIAQVAVLAGYRVRLNDIAQEILDGALKQLRATLDAGIERWKITESEKVAVLALIQSTTDFGKAVAGADLVIEAAPERLSLKKQVFQSRDHLGGPEAILASNTSSLSIAESVSHRSPSREHGEALFQSPAYDEVSRDRST